MHSKIFKSAGSLMLLAMLLFVSGCNKFLEEKPPSNLTDDAFFKIPDHAEAGLVSVYANMRFIGNDGGIFSSTWQLLEAPTGTSTTETAQNSDLNNLYSLTYDGNTQHVLNYWTGLYRVIANANLVIEKVPPITPMDEAQKKKIIGEAKFLRAWSYFYLVRLWGDVPLILNVQNAKSEDFMPTRTPKETVYAKIVEDLLAAEAAGLPWMDISGRVNLAAVKSQLAIVYLTMAGFPLNKGLTHYTLAAAKAKEVVDYANANPNTINLFTNYMDLHRETLENRLEHIFSLQYHVLVAGNPMTNMHPNFKPVTFAGPGGTGSTIPTPAFYASYEPGDKRAKNQEGFFYNTYYTNGNGAPFDLGAPYIFKHFNYISNGYAGVAGTRNNNLNVPLIRFAEVLLVYAEAQNEVSGPTMDAYNAFKRVRDRAELVTPLMATYTKDTFREAIWRERWHELAYEQITWFDMVRLRKVYNESTNGFDEFVGHINKSTNRPLQAKHLLFPIGIQEMKNNPNLTPNPGY